MKSITSKAALTATLLAALGTTLFAAPAFAATSHELRGYRAEYRASGSANDPAPSVVARLGCTINGTYLGEPYCFGGNQPSWIRVGESRLGGNRIGTGTY